MICKDCGVPCGVHGSLLDAAHESKREAFKELKQLRSLNEELREALLHLYHNAKHSGANMGLALDVAEAAIKKAEGW